MKPTHALSIRQPWADCILLGGKDIENRTWKLPARFEGSRIYVHAGKATDGEYAGDGRLGAILGEVTILRCVEDFASPWFDGPYGFVLADPVAYVKPIPWRGHLGFFRVDLEAAPR